MKLFVLTYHHLICFGFVNLQSFRKQKIGTPVRKLIPKPGPYLDLKINLLRHLPTYHYIILVSKLQFLQIQNQDGQFVPRLFNEPEREEVEGEHFTCIKLHRSYQNSSNYTFCHGLVLFEINTNKIIIINIVEFNSNY